jgi:hypothetical protein
MRTSTVLAAAIVIGIAACGGGGEQGSPDATAPTDLSSATPTPGIAVIRGTLIGSADGGPDATAQAVHDGIVANIRPMVQAAGDTGHSVFVGAQDGTQFLSIDSWSDLAAAQGVYSSAAFQSAFGSLFTGAPTIAFYVIAPGFDTYGSFKEAANGLSTFAFVVEGALKDTNVAMAASDHNAVLTEFKAQAMAGGDVAHVPFLGEMSTTSFFDVDIWQNPGNAQSFYTTPAVASAFAGLFTAAPTVSVYAATDWTQW